MHPVLISLPGWLFKFVSPGLILWGLYSLVVAFVRGVLLGSGDGGNGERGGGVLRRWWHVPADTPFHAVVSVAIGIGLFVFASPVQVGEGSWVERLVLALVAFGRGVLSRQVWAAPWTSLPIYSYGVMLGLSLLVGWHLTLGLAERQGLPRDRMGDCYIFTAFCAIVGARLLYVLTNLEEFRDPETGELSLSSMVALRPGGLVAYGGFLGGLVGSGLYLYRERLSLWKWADAAVPSLATGLTITRVGCYLYGCDFGKPLPSGVPGWLARLGTFPHWADGRGAPAWRQHVELGFRTDRLRCLDRFHGDWRDGICHLDPAARASAPVHPTQLYESLTGLVIFLVLLWLWRRRRFEGQIFLAFGVLYGFARALLEILRDDNERGFFFGLSTSQIIGLVTGVVCAVLYLWRRRVAPVAAPVDLFAWLRWPVRSKG